MYERFYYLIQEENWPRIYLIIHNSPATISEGIHISQTYYGVESLLINEVSQTTYVFCINHRLNLVAFHVRKSIKLARNFFSLLSRQFMFRIGSAWQAFFKRISALLYIRKTLSEHLAVFGGHVRTRLFLR
jgi:hypothetical protein